MSKIEELIKSFCPSGVDRLPLGSLSKISRGASPRPIKNFITTGEDGVNWIKIGDTTPGSKYIDSAAEKITQAGAEKSRYVKKGDFILSNSMSFGRPYILNIDGCVHDGWLVISEFSDYFTSDFLYHLLSSSAIQSEMRKKASFGGAVQNLNADIVRAIELPIPPIEVQNEIVNLLDKYSIANSQLVDELTRELEARKIQYGYYGNLLFTGKVDKNEWKTVGEVIKSLKTGLNPRQNFKLNLPGYDLPYITGKDVFDNTINVSDKTDLISQEVVELINKRACIETNDVLFASTGTGTVGRMAVVEEYNNDWAVSETMYCLKVKPEIINPYYLMYVLYSVGAKEQFEPKISKGSVPHLKVSDLLDVLIPVPAIEVQKQIVDAVKNFDNLCLKLVAELNNEIEARSMQFEYYRDKLLSFENVQ